MKNKFKIILVLILMVFNSKNILANSSSATKTNWDIFCYFINSENQNEKNNKIQNELLKIKNLNSINIYCEDSNNVSFKTFINAIEDMNNETKKILLVCGEGEGVYGFKTYKDNYIKLSQIKYDFNEVFEQDKYEPPFELVLFDGNMMANAEMGSVLYGYSKYYIAPIEYSYTNNGYKTWIDYLNENPNIEIENLGKFICDSFINSANDLMNEKDLIVGSQFSFLEVESLNNLYNLYSSLNKKILQKISNDNLMVSNISRIAKNTITVGDTLYDYKYNLLDYMNFAENLKHICPIEYSNIKREHNKALKYSNSTNLLSLHKGISIYFPVCDFKEHYELMNNYLENIANGDIYISSLFNYKLTGKIDESLATKLNKNGIKNIKSLDFNNIKNIDKTNVIANDNFKFDIELDKTVKEVLQGVRLLVYGRTNKFLKHYNEKEVAHLKNDYNVSVDFDGKWFTVDNNPLFVNVVSENDMYIKYSVDVGYNGIPATMYIVEDKKNKFVKIVGIVKKLGRNEIYGSEIIKLKDGDDINIFLVETNVDTNKTFSSTVNAFIYDKNKVLEEKILPDGDYSAYVHYEDLTGEKYNGEVVYFTITDGNVKGIFSKSELNK